MMIHDESMQTKTKFDVPGPGSYNPKSLSRNNAMRLSRFKTFDVSKKKHIDTSPGPQTYHNEIMPDGLSLTGGTGRHTGYKISFTKGERSINQDSEKNRTLPGPG